MSALKTTLPVHITVLKLECEPQSFYVSLNTARFTYGIVVFLALKKKEKAKENLKVNKKMVAVFTYAFPLKCLFQSG